jgi:hypothetical protein
MATYSTLTRTNDAVATLVCLDGPGTFDQLVAVEANDGVTAIVRVIGFPEHGYRVGDRFALDSAKVTGLR